MALRSIKELIGALREAPKYHEWFKIEYATPKQEEVIRSFAEQQGFEDLRGFNTWMRSKGWDYYDVIKVSCREE